mmetsp:Transcript_38160/g.96599  ORF Transcript_38160/g.96599 Transcript_38160/m.96599 type:complete len:298 (-) Transcript_38160:33-926(-)
MAPAGEPPSDGAGGTYGSMVCCSRRRMLQNSSAADTQEPTSTTRPTVKTTMTLVLQKYQPPVGTGSTMGGGVNGGGGAATSGGLGGGADADETTCWMADCELAGSASAAMEASSACMELALLKLAASVAPEPREVTAPANEVCATRLTLLIAVSSSAGSVTSAAAAAAAALRSAVAVAREDTAEFSGAAPSARRWRVLPAGGGGHDSIWRCVSRSSSSMTLSSARSSTVPLPIAAPPSSTIAENAPKAASTNGVSQASENSEAAATAKVLTCDRTVRTAARCWKSSPVLSAMPSRGW